METLPQASGKSPEPGNYETIGHFRGHLIVSFRPIAESDLPLLKELFYSHSRETILHRYLTPMTVFPDDMARKFVTPQFPDEAAVVGLIPAERRQRMIGVARCFRNPGSSFAEMAVTVHDGFQKRGIGTFLLRLLTRVARDRGITGFTAEVMADNHGMMRLIHNSARHVEMRLDAGVYSVRYPFEDMLDHPGLHRQKGRN